MYILKFNFISAYKNFIVESRNKIRGNFIISFNSVNIYNVKILPVLILRNYNIVLCINDNNNITIIRNITIIFLSLSYKIFFQHNIFCQWQYVWSYQLIKQCRIINYTIVVTVIECNLNFFSINIPI